MRLQVQQLQDTLPHGTSLSRHVLTHALHDLHRPAEQLRGFQTVSSRLLYQGVRLGELARQLLTFLRNSGIAVLSIMHSSFTRAKQASALPCKLYLQWLQSCQARLIH